MDVEQYFREEDDGPVVNKKILELMNCWRTEVHAPEILQYQSSLVDQLKEKLFIQQSAVHKIMDSAAESGSADENFTATLYQMDIERIRYSLSRYLRTRLVKIEKYLYSFQDRSKLEKLSFQEQVFATKLLGLTNSQLEMFFKHFENQKDVRAVVESHEDLVNDCQPRMTDFVYCQSTSDLYDFSLEFIQSGVWNKSDLKIMPYYVIRDYVESGKVILL